MAEKKTAEKPAPVKPENVEVYIPKENRNDEDLFISVNGKRILVKKGVTLHLPPEFAEVIKNSQEQARVADSYIDAMARD